MSARILPQADHLGYSRRKAEAYQEQQSFPDGQYRAWPASKVAYLVHGLQSHAREAHRDGLSNKRLPVSFVTFTTTITCHQSTLMNWVVQDLGLYGVFPAAELPSHCSVANSDCQRLKLA